MKVGEHMFPLFLKPGVRSCEFRKGGERGATFVEFAGIAIVVAILIGGVIAVAPSHGRDISCSIFSKISEAIGAGGMQCGRTDDKAQEDKHKPTGPCTVSQKSQSLNGEIKGVVVSAEVNGGIITEKLSNGHYRVTYRVGAKGGGVTGEGGGAGLTVNNQTYGGGTSVNASANVAAEGGVSFEVDSEQAKDALHQYVIREIVSSSAGPAGQAINGLLPMPNGYQPPQSTEVYGQVGTEGSASAEAKAGIGEAKGKVGTAAALGAKYNLDTGEVTAYYKVSAEAAGSLGAGGASGEAGVSGDMVVAVKTKKDDPNKVLNVSLSGSYNAQLGASTPLGVGSDAPVGGGSAGMGQVWNASVDLTSAEQNKIARNILAAAKVPGYDRGQNSGENLNEATSTFINAATDRGVLTRQNVAKTSVNSGFKAEAGDGLVIGFSVGGAEENVSYSNGQYYSDGEWKSWEGC